MVSVVDKSSVSVHDLTFIQVLASVGVAICFITTIALFLMKIFHKLGSCCRDLFSKSDNVRPDENENKYQLMKKLPILRHEQLSGGKARYEPLASGNKFKPMSLSMESLDSYRNAQFEIPGMLSCQAIQPFDTSSTTSGYSTSGLSHAESMDTCLDNRVFVDEYIQPQEREAFHSITRKAVLVSSLRKRESFDADGVMPELYETDIRRTQGSSSLGKIRFSLQYENKMKRKLIMTLHDIVDLQFGRGTDHVTHLYVSAVLLPERDYRFQTKELARMQKININETFTFHSRPHNRDFESRTVHLTIMYVEKSRKEYAYGESRMALLSNEIYSQVPTDITVGIKGPSPYNEVGDAQVVLSYSSEQNRLNVMVKTVKFHNSALDHLAGIHIKAHLTRVGGEKLGKKKSVSRSLASCVSNLIEFQDHMSFHLEPENYMLCTLKMNVHGKHKIMRKHISLGKIRIGEGNRDDGGKVHWRTVINSEGIGWTMWHSIYSS